MEEPKRIVLILGNGFDLDLGLKTSYKDFWESEFCPKDYPAPLIRHLNNKWGKDINAVRWYDLENELYFYAKNGNKSDVIDNAERAYIRNHSDYELSLASSYDDIDECFHSLYDAGIIKIEGVLRSAHIPYRDDLMESAAWRDRKAFHLIKERLCRYLVSITGQPALNHCVALAVLEAVNYSREAGNFLNIYTFNYTPLPVEFSKIFQSILHYVHGNCRKGEIIIGTRDDVDIDTDYDFLQKAFDPSFNPPGLVSDLLEADDVIFFGHSIGENDRQYFKSFFKQLTDFSSTQKKDISFFTLDENSEVDIKRSLQKMTENNLSTLFGLNNVVSIKTSRLKHEPDPIKTFLSKYITNPLILKFTLNHHLNL